MLWNVSTLIALFATIIYIAIFTLVAISKPRNRVRRIFGSYLLAMVVWSISAFLTISGLGNVLTWFRVMAASPIAMMVAIFFFVQTIFGLRRKWAPFTILYGIVAILIALFTNLVVKSAFLSPLGDLDYELNFTFVLVAVPGYILLIVSLVELIKGHANSQDSHHRLRLRYLVIGLCVTMLSSLFNFTPLGKYPIDVAANVITAFLIAYAILRHQLLDIKIVIRYGLLYSVTTAIFSAIYYLIISLILNIFQLFARRELLLISIVVGALSAFILAPLRKQAQTWVDRLFYREKYNAGLMLQRLSQTTTSVLNLEEIANLILSEITNTLHIQQGAILIKNSEGNDFQAIAQNGATQDLTIGFHANHPIVTWMIQQNRILTKQDLSIIPTFRSLWGKERQELEKFQAELFIPLTTKDKLAGLIVLGPKLSSQPYSQEDQVFLSTLANQTAVAVENARLYDELEDSFVQTVVALANAIDIRDTYTSTHSQQIARWAEKTARQLGCQAEMIKSIYWSGLLHDIGKIGVPDSILRKKGKLNDEEWEIIHQHPTRGAEIIAPIKKLAHIAPLVECSHERYDGQGYPFKMKGEQIPLGARIIAVVDSYSAMIDERPYKKRFTTYQAIKELEQNVTIMYDPVVVNAFLNILKEETILPDLDD